MMTWNEFKQHVDTILETKGISPDSKIFYIDTHMPETQTIGVETEGTDDLMVCYDENEGIIIYS